MMKNKKGSMILRDVIFIIIIFSGVIALSSIFVSEMGNTYGNTNMTASYNQDLIGNTQLNETTTKWQEIGENLDGNVFEMLLGTLKAAGEVLKEVLTAPVTFGNMLESILSSFGVAQSLSNIIGFILTAVLYIVIIFVIISAFLQGGKL